MFVTEGRLDRRHCEDAIGFQVNRAGRLVGIRVHCLAKRTASPRWQGIVQYVRRSLPTCCGHTFATNKSLDVVRLGC